MDGVASYQNLNYRFPNYPPGTHESYPHSAGSVIVVTTAGILRIGHARAATEISRQYKYSIGGLETFSTKYKDLDCTGDRV